MSSGRDIESPTSSSSDITPKLFESETLARRFQLRAIEMAKEGVLGSLRTRKASLQNSYALLLSLLDNTMVPILIFGEPGAGKRRHVDEFMVVHNFYRKLEGQSFGRLRVFRGDFVSEGFTAQFVAPFTNAADIIYLEACDRLNEKCQQELLEHLQLRRKFAETGLPQPRIVVGTDRALSILVLRKEFNRELFQALTAFALFLPSLNERSEDMLSLIQAFTEEMTGRVQVPPTWLVDTLSRPLWPGNLDDLKRLLRASFVKNPRLETWTVQDLPVEFRPNPPRSQNFAQGRFEDVTTESRDRTRFKQALMSSGGDRDKAAREVGLSKEQFLKKIFALGLR
jgi:DNA-binding NtrC family response regulator